MNKWEGLGLFGFWMFLSICIICVTALAVFGVSQSNFVKVSVEESYQRYADCEWIAEDTGESIIHRCLDSEGEETFHEFFYMSKKKENICNCGDYNNLDCWYGCSPKYRMGYSAGYDEILHKLSLDCLYEITEESLEGGN